MRSGPSSSKKPQADGGARDDQAGEQELATGEAHPVVLPRGDEPANLGQPLEGGQGVGLVGGELADDDLVEAALAEGEEALGHLLGPCP